VTNRNSVLEKINKKSSQEQNDKEKINHQTTKTNINLNYDNEKVLILEMETENHETQDKLIITKTGLVDSLRRKRESSDDYVVYFGYKEHDNDTEGNIDYYLPVTVTKSAEMKEKNNNNNNQNNYKNAFFKIFYDNEKSLYYLMDLGQGYGTFYKIVEETIIIDNTIINIGESYLIFSFKKNNENDEEEINENDLYLKIYSNEGEYDPLVIQSVEKVYKIGRSEKCDIFIKDKMLSRVHCELSFIDNNWYIKDGNEDGVESTNGTWVYANDETEIKEGMKFKSNSCNFVCKFQ